MTAPVKHAFTPDYTVAPGVTLLETIEHLGMTQRELALRTGLTIQTVNRIINGEQPVTYETAALLECVTQVPAQIWNNLEARYRERQAMAALTARLQRDIAWLKQIPVRELVDRGYITDTTDRPAQLREVLCFYGVASVDAWRDVWMSPQVAARRSSCFATAPGPASAWIRQGELAAVNAACEPYNREMFLQSLREIRILTVQRVETIAVEMQRLCARAGVALVFVKEMSKVPWNGASKWISPARAMIIVSFRGKREDRFWFSFFHEAGHVLYSSKRGLHIADDNRDPEERRADKFAASFLIPRECDSDIVAASTDGDIMAIAGRLKISAGIVAGRYQFLTKQWSHFNHLIKKINWA